MAHFKLKFPREDTCSDKLHGVLQFEFFIEEWNDT